MRKVGNFEANEDRMLGVIPKELVGLSFGNNEKLLDSYNKGMLDTFLTLGGMLGGVCFVGKTVKNKPKALLDLMNEVMMRFDIMSDGKYYFSIKDCGDGDIILEGSTEIFAWYKPETDLIRVNDSYRGKGVDKLKDKFKDVLKWICELPVPVSQVTIYPMNEECFSNEYLSRVSSFYVGFREAVFNQEFKGDFEMLCSYEEKPGEFVVCILV